MKRKFTVKVVGGLGNQLFGLTFGLLVAGKMNAELNIDGSLIKYGSNMERKLQITNLDLNCKNVKYVNKFLTKVNINSKLLKKVMWKMATHKNQKESEIQSPFFKFTNNQKFVGYFQNWLYADILHQQGFNLLPKTLLNEDSSFRKLVNVSKDIFVHIRLGDYLQFPNLYTIVPESYYVNGIKAINLEKSNGKIVLFVENKKELTDFYPKLLSMADLIIDKSSRLDDLESFMFLSSANQIIASNSTYSMWAAWCVKNRNGIALVPDIKYFHQNSQKLVDDRWDKVDTSTGGIIRGKFNIERHSRLENQFNLKF
jgi:hypothetical protein